MLPEDHCEKVANQGFLQAGDAIPLYGEPVGRREIPDRRCQPSGWPWSPGPRLKPSTRCTPPSGSTRRVGVIKQQKPYKTENKAMRHQIVLTKAAPGKELGHASKSQTPKP